MEMKYVREPGYVYDLFSPFVIHFNKAVFFPDTNSKASSLDEKEYFNSILDYFGEISEELYPFFYMKDSSQTFITERFFYAFQDRMFDTYSFKTVLDALSDIEQVKKDLLSFYFCVFPENELEKYSSSVQTVANLIMGSAYSDRIKCGLYTFFINPAAIIQKLIHALMSAEVKLAQYYEKNYQKLLDMQANLDFDDLFSRLKKLGFFKNEATEWSAVYVTVCLVLRNCVKTLYTNDKTFLILGWDYDAYIEQLALQRSSIQLDVLGTAFSEPNRVEIFELMHQKGEITIKDIEQTMKISGTNAYYHMMLMLKANVIQTRNRGRTVCYSINKNQIDLICEHFSRYGNNTSEVK